METEYQKIGRRIHVLRAGKGISQGNLAKQMGLSQTNLSNIEKGKTKATLKNLFKMQEILGCSMRDFFEDAAEEETFNMEETMEAVRVMKKLNLRKLKTNKKERCAKMEMTKGKTKRILLSLLLCSVISSSAYAADGDIATLDVESGKTYASRVTNSSTIDGYENCTFDTERSNANPGGALYNSGTGTIGNIKDSYFINNGYYDAYNYDGTSYGGAIYNAGTINSITGTEFSGNQVLWSGGAIDNYGGTITVIDDCTFSGNYAYDDGGGAICNDWGTITTIQNSVFENNEAGWAGGAIANYDTIGKIYNCTFTANVTDWDYGGAINNWYKIETIDESTFSENEAYYGGGAIYNGYGEESDGDTYGTITTISNSKFESNKANWGAAIYNSNYALIGSIYNCEFTGNKAEDSHIVAGVEGLSYGGAIFNYNYAYITSIDQCVFTSNSADDGDGGAIYNYDGAVINSITNSTFTSNYAGQDGGAIYNFWEPDSEYGEGIIGNIDNVTFEKNTSVNYGGALFNHGYIGLDSDGETVTGGITNSTFTGNKSGRGGAIYNGIQRESGSSESSFNSIITSIDNCYFYQNVADEFGGAIYNYDDGYIWNISNNIFEENKALDGNGGAIENADSGSDIGTISGNTFVKNTATGGGAAIYNEGIIDSITDNTFKENQAGTYGGAIYNAGTISEISGDTFTGNSAVSESGEAAGGAIYNSGTISTFSVKDLSGNYAEGATSAMGGAIYDETSTITVTGDVTGNYATASSGEAKGGAIYAGEGTVVTLSGNITGNSATGDTAKGGAIYNAGKVNVNIENKDAVISGNKTVSGGTEEANVLYGEAASVTNFNLTDATLRLDDSLTGETGFEVNISGNGTDATTFYMYNDILDSNLSIGGTTLNTINNEVKTYSVNKFTVAGDFNMVADVDLANETMDRFVTNGNSYGEAKGSLNVSGMNLISDTTADRVGIYFAEPGLKENVTSSVGTLPGSEQQTAYTPLYQYSVTYDKNYDGSWGDDGGYFVFDKQGNNPAAMMPTIAQMGLFNAMNMMFEYCFEHSDYYMKLPSETRLAIREKAKAAKAAKLAEKNGTTAIEESQKIDDARAEEMASREGDKFYDHDNVLPLYDQHELTRPGAWVKTFATKESIPFTGKFTAKDKYYGGIIGVDSDFREDKKGWGNVFTGYAGYQGIHQSYSGGSIRQDGGMLGATETFYKKNFYTAWTIAAASTSAKGRNMYGHESSRLYTYGIATKSGWNLEYDGGKYIVLPTFMASYTTVDMRDYTNAAGLRVDADNMRAVQLNPNIKWIRNYSNGWQPYLTAGEVWTVGQKSRVRVDGTKLDELHLRPYTEYGLGVQKRWAHDYDGYAEFLGHAGGRRGFLAKLGFRWTFN